MAPPKTREETLRQMRMLWFAYLATIPLYIYAGKLTNFDWLHFQNAVSILAFLGILDLIYFAFLRSRQFARASDAVRIEPGNMHTITRWRISWTILLALPKANHFLASVSKLETNP